MFALAVWVYFAGKPLAKRADLDDLGFTFHALRHTFATAHFERGPHPKIVQYSHVMPGMSDVAATAVEEALR